MQHRSLARPSYLPPRWPAGPVTGPAPRRRALNTSQSRASGPRWRVSARPDRPPRPEPEDAMTTEAQSTIYHAIGGDTALVAVVDDFYDRVLADPELAGFFAGTSMARLKGRQGEVFAAALRAPAA